MRGCQIGAFTAAQYRKAVARGEGGSAGNGVEMASLGRKKGARPSYQISKTKLAKGSLKPKGSAKEAASEAWYLGSEPAAIKPPAYTETYRSPPSLRAT